MTMTMAMTMTMTMTMKRSLKKIAGLGGSYGRISPTESQPWVPRHVAFIELRAVIFGSLQSNHHIDGKVLVGY